jgi:UDP-glucose 4-epimerase
MAVLICGGVGFIGSHTVLVMLEAGEEVVVVDNLCNSNLESLRRVARLTGRDPIFIKADLRDSDALDDVFSRYPIESIIHFAGLKAVGESVEKPLLYFDNNLIGTIRLCEAMERHGVKRLVFSSSATVYGIPERCPITEDFPLSSINPYGRTKLMTEEMLGDIVVAHPDWSVALLRYFNPVGAHPSGEIGENPNGIPNNLMPYITQVAVGKLAQLSVYGSDYPTPDGTGIRDYIHIMDLAEAHLAALRKTREMTGIDIWNLGTGLGTSVLELIAAFERTTLKPIPYRFTARRPGDAAESYCDPGKAHRELNWRATRTLDDICRDAWNWQQRNPEGFPE